MSLFPLLFATGAALALTGGAARGGDVCDARVVVPAPSPAPRELAFLENRGQWPEAARFHVHGIKGIDIGIRHTGGQNKRFEGGRDAL